MAVKPIPTPPRILIIGAGSRGHSYSRAIHASGLGTVAAIAEPIAFKRKDLGQRFIWGPEKSEPRPEEHFEGWRQFAEWEEARRKRKGAGEEVEEGVDGVVVCVLDEMVCCL